MSGIAEEQLEFWEHGLCGLKETFICSKHIDDYAIKDFIRKESVRGDCSYCSRPKKVIPFQKLIYFIMKGIMSFYTDAAEFMAYESSEGGYLGETYSPEELINDQIGLNIDNTRLNTDITDCIDDRAWSNPYLFYDNDLDILIYHWEYFKDVTKHKSRYVFAQCNEFKSSSYRQNPFEILNEIGTKINEFKLIKSLSKGSRLFRCRQHRCDEIISSADQLTSPPEEFAIYSNRMSPAGISMFYGAFNNQTAIAETIDSKKLAKARFTTAIFQPNRDLNVIDLTELPKATSMFDSDNIRNYYSTRFLRNFVTDISKPIKRDGKEHIDYVPTQIVTEYFRYIFNHYCPTKIREKGE